MSTISSLLRSFYYILYDVCSILISVRFGPKKSCKTVKRYFRIQRQRHWVLWTVRNKQINNMTQCLCNDYW